MNDNKPTKYTTLKDDYLLTEFKELQEEKRGALSDIAKDRILGVIFSGAFWSWFAINWEKLKDLRYFGYVAPILIFLLTAKWKMMCLSVDEKAAYIKKSRGRSNWF